MTSQQPQQMLLSPHFPYIMKTVQYIQNPNAPKPNQKSHLLFSTLSPQALELRSISKSLLVQLETQQELNETQIMKRSQCWDSIQYGEIIRQEKKVHNINGAQHYIVGIYDQKGSEKNKAKFVVRLGSQLIMEAFYQDIGERMKEEKEYLKKSVTNFLGIEENARKILEKILISSPNKKFVYTKIIQKINQKKISLSLQLSKKMIYCLMGNHPQMQNFLRKQRIQSYDTQKRKYEDSLRNDTEIPSQPSQILQSYSQKRKLDGILPKRQKGADTKTSEELFFSKIPQRSELQLDTYLNLIQKPQKMQIQYTFKRNLPQTYRAEKVKVPVKQYGLIGKQEVQWVRKEIIANQSIDHSQANLIEIVKFMYQIMRNKGNSLDQVLECAKELLTECEHRQDDRKSLENKNIADFIKLANKNYLQYRRNPNKFY